MAKRTSKIMLCLLNKVKPTNNQLLRFNGTRYVVWVDCYIGIDFTQNIFHPNYTFNNWYNLPATLSSKFPSTNSRDFQKKARLQ